MGLYADSHATPLKCPICGLNLMLDESIMEEENELRWLETAVLCQNRHHYHLTVGGRGCISLVQFNPICFTNNL